MTWVKQGLIFSPPGTSWRAHSALQPTPILADGGRTIRVFVGFRDAEGIGRVGWVDLDAADPHRVTGVSETPALDIGRPGTFDDNGVVPCAVVERPDGIYLYYAGYSLPQKVRFHVFGGLAISQDGGSTFRRVSEAPVLDRTDGELFFRVLHSIHYDGRRWQAWYGAGSAFEDPGGGGRTRAVYNIRYMESEDGVHFPDRGEVCIDVRGDEHRVGRPYVVRGADGYQMYFAAATRSDNYRLTYADSADGRRWTVRPEVLGLHVSEEGWDSEMMSYPSVVDAGGRTYLFYNGNDYGRAGFGVAVWEG
jgi:hypothetical protein